MRNALHLSSVAAVLLAFGLIIGAALARQDLRAVAAPFSQKDIAAYPPKSRP